MPRKSAKQASGDRAVWRSASMDERRRIICRAGIELINRRGLEALTIRAVAAKVGLGTMSLYTYFTNHHALRLAIIRTGFELLNSCCAAASTLGTVQGWRGSARAYLQFAIDQPNLYTLMFNTPLPEAEDASGDLEAVFANLVDRVQSQLDRRRYRGKALRREARRRAETYWIAVHGLASLVIARRLTSDMERLLDELLARVAPTGTVLDD
ncbi:MAG: TetR/AcrR family transcriptional regulator [Phycisphaeraceae bacterium]|nr:TetR/AcrR family transcriptional regulator [Phycisphaeraceae bacterium]